MTSMENTIVTADELARLEQKAKVALRELKEQFKASMEYIDVIFADFARNMNINTAERPCYQDADTQIGYILHDWTPFSMGQNDEVLKWLKDLRNYRDAKEAYLEEFNKTH